MGRLAAAAATFDDNKPEALWFTLESLTSFAAAEDTFLCNGDPLLETCDSVLRKS